jgi:hypothetical protein
MKDIRQRMIGDMKLRGLTPCTQATYLEAVKVPARHYNSRLDEITKEHVRDFLLYLLDSISHRLFPIDQPITLRAISKTTNPSVVRL